MAPPTLHGPEGRHPTTCHTPAPHSALSARRVCHAQRTVNPFTTRARSFRTSRTCRALLGRESASECEIPRYQSFSRSAHQNPPERPRTRATHQNALARAPRSHRPALPPFHARTVLPNRRRGPRSPCGRTPAALGRPCDQVTTQQSTQHEGFGLVARGVSC